MKGIDARSGVIIGAERPDGGKQPIRFGKAPAEISGRTFALVISRRVQDLLAVTGQPQVRQTLDRLEEWIDARLGEQIEAEIAPELVHLDKCGRLGVLAIFSFEKIVQNAHVVLIADL